MSTNSFHLYLISLISASLIGCGDVISVESVPLVTVPAPSVLTPTPAYSLKLQGYLSLEQLALKAELVVSGRIETQSNGVTFALDAHDREPRADGRFSGRYPVINSEIYVEEVLYGSKKLEGTNISFFQNGSIETGVDLSPELKEGESYLLYLVKPAPLNKKSTNAPYAILGLDDGVFSLNGDAIQKVSEKWGSTDTKGKSLDDIRQYFKMATENPGALPPLKSLEEELEELIKEAELRNR